MHIIRPSVSLQVIEYLRNHIGNGTWEIGEKIPSENALTKVLGVSRASIRLAIQQFIALGVLESVHGKGTFLKTKNLHALDNNSHTVTDDECKDVAKVLEFRLIVEPGGCFLAAQKADAHILGSLSEHLNRMMANIGNLAEFVKYDIEFHAEIGRASGNPLLAKTLQNVFSQTREKYEQIVKIFGYKDGIYYHSLILKAFEGHDAKLARKLMTEHLQSALDQITATDNTLS